MTKLAALDREVFTRTLEHLLRCVEGSQAIHDPFSHVYLEEVFPADVYEQILSGLPDPALYDNAAERHHGKVEKGYTRSMFALVPNKLAALPGEGQGLWRGIAAALTSPDLKRAMFAKLSRDLAFRYGVPEPHAERLAGHARPTLYRETEGFEIPPHPDTRKKVVTMHLYLPADRSQADLGTALYRAKRLALPLGPWQGRFVKVKQFCFHPNSGYAFVVNHSLRRTSWHGRERLPAGAGVRNTLLNTFYEQERAVFDAYRN